MNQTYCPCPKCASLRTRVVCTKRDDDGITIRRRWCPACEHRWYSLQYPEVVIKSSEVKWGKSGSDAKFVPSA